jgi:hypothetical protein
MSDTEEKKPRPKQEINVEYTQLASQLGHNVFEIKRIHSVIKQFNIANEEIKYKMDALTREKSSEEIQAKE